MTKLEILKKRAEIIQAVRNFFIDSNYLEIETPVMSPFLIPESTIEVFKTEMVSPYSHETGTFYLTPSPEIWMKKLLSMGAGSIFQITKSFRNSEQSGALHNPEFTMLEWYTTGADYMDSMVLTEKLFNLLYRRFGSASIAPPFIKMSINEAFIKYASINLEHCPAEADLAHNAKAAGFTVNKSYNWEEAFNYIFLTAVEPALPAEHPVILYDYPRQIPCLAKQKDGTPWFERWELYINGIETANCYTEETDKNIIARFFLAQSEFKKDALVPLDTDLSYADIFSENFPACSGTALGLDRLVMAVTGVKNIKDVLSIFFN